MSNQEPPSNNKPSCQPNIAEPERVPSVVVGAAMLVYGLLRFTPGSILLAALGGFAIARGVTKCCPINAAFGVSRAERGA